MKNKLLLSISQTYDLLRSNLYYYIICTGKFIVSVLS